MTPEVLGRGARDRRLDLRTVELAKDLGEIGVAGREGLLDEPLWYWPKRQPRRPSGQAWPGALPRTRCTA
ncbi:hypothetical protein [Streptomyces sp. NBC_00690]|uniref:hypothetical protein n=1 Tax=Streptomyces sp. NBC_00690 TaxID=2975808 RepID=UPI002E2E4DCB|nr:hypothetical protein [Streptomyces sp. NBC_00690]